MSVTATEAFRLAAASHLSLVAALLMRDYRRSRVAASSLVLIGCVVSYLALPTAAAQAVPMWVRWMAAAGALAVPFAFWIAARVWFDDSFDLRSVHVSLMLALVALRGLVMHWPMVSSAIAAVVVLEALYRIHAGGRSDLLLQRLRLRYVILTGTGIYALLILTGEAMLARQFRLTLGLDAANDIGLYLLTAGVCMAVFRIDPDLVRAGAKPAGLPEPANVLAKRLEHLIEEEHVFETEGLTIGALAERLGEHEYKVRQLINTSLGFRNFGAFLNNFRVREARKLLADPGQKQLGIAEIAYRLGYSSIGPFNRAFKEIAGQTPTEYRKSALDEQRLADFGIGQPSSKRR